MRIVTVLAAVLLVLRAEARTCVVDQHHLLADDTNPGTEEKPWKTLRRAAQDVQAGDTVYVLAGAYDERIAPAHSGSEGKRITFKSVPARAASIKGVDTEKCHYLTIEGFTISETDFGIRIASDHVEVLDNYFFAIKRYPIIGKGAGVTLAYNEIYHCQFGIVTGGSGWTVENNEVRRLFNYGTLGDCDYCRPFGENHVFRYNFFHGSTQEEIGKAHVDCFQVFDNNGEIARHITIENNVGLDFHQALMAEGKFHPGNIEGITFKKNIFSSRKMGAWGLCVVEVPQITALNNTFADIFYHGIGFSGERARGGLARNNIFAHLRTSYWADKTDCAGDHNLVYQCQAPKKLGTGDVTNVDPRFVDSEKGNYRLRRGSPAVGAGSDGSDAGAVEYPNVYYVDPRHPGASDESFGYTGWPFKTLAAACRVADPGETIVLRGGIFREVLAPAHSGVTIRAMEGERPILSGADLLTGWRQEGSAWATALESAPKRLLMDGRAWTDFTYDAVAKRITLRGMDDPRLHVLEAVVRERAVDCTGATGVQIQGIDIVNVQGKAFAGQAKLRDVTVNGKQFDPAAEAR